MIRFIVPVILALCLALPASATEYTAPEVPDAGRDLMPAETEHFGRGLSELLKKACFLIRPDLGEAVKVGTGVIASTLLISILRTFSGFSKDAVNLSGVVIISLQLLSSANAMIQLGCDTINELSNYGKLLLPVMASALAAQGGISSAGALYVGTTVFDTLLSSMISSVFVPMVFILLTVGVAGCALGDETLKKLLDLGKSVLTWSLKTVLIAYMAYMGITGVISGTTDAAALKATRLTISTVVPVVGGILSDASEAVLISVGAMKNAAGIYGILAAAAISLEPFLRISAHYLVLKGTGADCTIIDPKGTGGILDIFSSAMGMILAMTGVSCLLLLISTVCFLRGMS